MSVFFDWAESTRISRMSGLTDFDSSSEVFEIAQEFADDKVVVRLINKALAAGVRFAPDEVMALMLQIDKPTLTKLADTVSEPFSTVIYHIGIICISQIKSLCDKQKRLSCSMFSVLEQSKTCIFSVKLDAPQEKDHRIHQQMNCL